MNGTQAYALSRKLVNGVASGVKSAIVDEDAKTITFNFTNGTSSVMRFNQPKDGISIIDVDIDTSNNHLIITMSDGEEIDAGVVPSVQGERGKQGEQGEPGENGKSAYELAVLAGFVGTQDEWLASLEGDAPTIVENPDNIGDIYKLDIINSDGSTLTTPNLKGSGGAEYFDNPDTTLISVGGLSTGSNIYGKSTKEVLEAILYPYQKPTIDFAISPTSLFYDITSDSIDTIKLTTKVTRKSYDISFVKFYANDELIYTVEDGYSKGGTFSYQYTPDIPITSSTIFKVVTNDGKNNVEKTIEIKFVGKTYYGYLDSAITDPTIDDIKSLNSTTIGTKEYTYNNISFTDKKICYAYPVEFEKLTSIQDANGFDYMSSYTQSAVTIDDIDYYVYLLTNSVTVANFKQTYK